MNPSVKAAVNQTLDRLDSTHKALNIKSVFEAWDGQRDRLFALIAAVNTRLAKDEDFYNEVQLLEIAEDILGNTSEVNRLKKMLGVPV